MYLAHFKLKEEPFRLTPDPEFLYLSKQHIKAKTYLDFAIWRNDGFVVITGEIGSGKTTVLNSVVSSLDKNIIVARIHQTLLNENELLQSIMVELGIKYDGTNKVDLITRLNEYLIAKYRENKKVVLVIDEAQNLGVKVLEELRLLSGLETNDAKLINIVIVGQPELKTLLESVELEQLAQRIRLQFHIDRLSPEDTVEYIQYRLKKAGSENETLFIKDVYPYIYNYTGGIPRLINILCDTALIVSYADGKRQITIEEIKQAIKDLQWVTYKRRMEKLKIAKTTKNKKSGNEEWVSIKYDTLPLDFDLGNVKPEE